MDTHTLPPANSNALLKELGTAIRARLDEITLLNKIIVLGPERILRFVYRDVEVQMYLPHAGQDRVQSLILHSSQFFECPLLEKVLRFLPPGMTIIDAGANIGNHSIFFGKICRAKAVHSFEPMKQTFRILARNVYINDLATNVHTHNLGLGAQIGRASLHFYTSANSGAAALRPDDNGPYELTTIDSLNLAECGFIKIDVEGLHKEVLTGARDTINRHKPLIWIELRNYGVHKEYDEGDAFMKSVGYKQMMAITTADFLYGPS